MFFARLSVLAATALCVQNLWMLSTLTFKTMVAATPAPQGTVTVPGLLVEATTLLNEVEGVAATAVTDVEGAATAVVTWVADILPRRFDVLSGGVKYGMDGGPLQTESCVAEIDDRSSMSVSRHLENIYLRQVE
ncbi:hypothetical protein C8F04DRAFT_1180139 [Mycena alexandri]|uniref:Uncharacterized protein n=1 Tax=Mycena alexandri TaxID=1745969 RepID=A0AAD6T403_9AGAR|nr:hypothetical protein C8F04DRAFT_1180139 [Mycena alexandri]